MEIDREKDCFPDVKYVSSANLVLEQTGVFLQSRGHLVLNKPVNVGLSHCSGGSLPWFAPFLAA
jgi:hypothetical protein